MNNLLVNIKITFLLLTLKLHMNIVVLLFKSLVIVMKQLIIHHY